MRVLATTLEQEISNALRLSACVFCVFCAMKKRPEKKIDRREGYGTFLPVDVVYALPVPLVEQLGLKSEMREARPLPTEATLP